MCAESLRATSLSLRDGRDLIYGSPQKRAQRAAAEREVAEAAAAALAGAAENEGLEDKGDIDSFEEAAQMPEELALAEDDSRFYPAQDMQDKKGL